MKVLSAVTALALMLTAAVFYPTVHNRYVFPLGRLYGSIHEGEPCTKAAERFRTYIADRRGDSHFQARQFVATTDLLETEAVPPGRAFHLYDLSAFDDVQLSIRCDSSGKIAETLFIGD